MVQVYQTGPPPQRNDMPIFVLFLLVPLIEIGLFIKVGGLIGLWPTLAIVVATAILGTWMMREQGMRELGKLKTAFEDLRDPTEPLAGGAMILFAGALLLTPGFFTDTVGLLLLIPAVRRAVYRYIRARVNVSGFRVGPQPGVPPKRGPAGGDVIDGEYEEVKPTDRVGDSGWTRH